MATKRMATKPTAVKPTAAKSTATTKPTAADAKRSRPGVFSRPIVLPAVGIGAVTLILAMQENASFPIALVVGVAVALVVIGMIALKRALQKKRILHDGRTSMNWWNTSVSSCLAGLLLPRARKLLLNGDYARQPFEWDI